MGLTICQIEPRQHESVIWTTIDCDTAFVFPQVHDPEKEGLPEECQLGGQTRSQKCGRRCGQPGPGRSVGRVDWPATDTSTHFVVTYVRTDRYSYSRKISFMVTTERINFSVQSLILLQKIIIVIENAFERQVKKKK